MDTVTGGRSCSVARRCCFRAAAYRADHEGVYARETRVLTKGIGSAGIRGVGATRRPASSNCLTTVPGARTTTTTPSRTRTATRAPTDGRVVSRTRASWSPGSAFGGTLAETRSDADVRAGSARRFGRSFSQAAAERAPRARRIRGLPRRLSANPALETSTTRRFVPEFVRRTAAREVPARTTRAGAAVSATGVRVVLAPAGASASAKTQTATRTAGGIIDRSR